MRRRADLALTGTDWTAMATGSRARLYRDDRLMRLSGNVVLVVILGSPPAGHYPHGSNGTRSSRSLPMILSGSIRSIT
jgi:hypothetical protein